VEITVYWDHTMMVTARVTKTVIPTHQATQCGITIIFIVTTVRTCKSHSAYIHYTCKVNHTKVSSMVCVFSRISA
jgi:hypothetical protein